MKKLEIIAKPSKLELIRDALEAEGATDIIVSEVKQFIPTRAIGNEIGEISIDYSPKIKIELQVAIEQVVPMVNMLKSILQQDECKLILYDVSLP